MNPYQGERCHAGDILSNAITNRMGTAARSLAIGGGSLWDPIIDRRRLFQFRVPRRRHLHWDVRLDAGGDGYAYPGRTRGAPRSDGSLFVPCGRRCASVVCRSSGVESPSELFSGSGWSAGVVLCIPAGSPAVATVAPPFILRSCHAFPLSRCY